MKITRSMQIVALTMVIGMTGCDSKTEWTSEDYAVYWIDRPSNRMLGRKLASGNFIGRVEAVLIAVGENERYVVAIRRDTKGDELFYYIEKSVDTEFKNGSDVVEGPFERSEFEKRRAKYRLPEFEQFF